VHPQPVWPSGDVSPGRYSRGQLRDGNSSATPPRDVGIPDILPAAGTNCDNNSDNNAIAITGGQASAGTDGGDQEGFTAFAANGNVAVVP